MDKILILDFGSQYTQLIARRIRELNIYSEIHPHDLDIKILKQFSPKAIILSGGPNSVYEDDTPKAPKEIFELNIPILGICYGMQTLINQFGGKVETSSKREFGYAEIRAHGHSKLFKDIQDKANNEGHGLLDVWMSHGDKVTDIPKNFKVIASNASTPIAAIADENKLLYGVQFHPEVTHTKQGKNILKRFSIEIAKCSPDWNMPDYVNTAVKSIKEQVQNDHVILGLSGGVDSSVAAALIHKAIGNQLTCIFVDHGLLRLNEGKKVMETFNKNLGVKVIHVDASKKFMEDLKDTSDPEEKRKIIGKDFVEIFQEEAKKINNAKWLA